MRLAGLLLFIAAYTSLSHYSNSVAKTHDLGVALALGPILLVLLVMIARSTHWGVTLLAAATAGVVLRTYWPALEKNFSVVYLIQEVGFYGLMAASFARSLRTGSVALCTELADRLHGPLSMAELRYTRQVTAAWALFFLAVAIASYALFSLAPLRLWSLFANFCVPPLIALMFIGEFLVRRRLLPQVAKRGILDSIRVYFARSA